jgi:hypothetical protein
LWMIKRTQNDILLGCWYRKERWMLERAFGKIIWNASQDAKKFYRRWLWLQLLHKMCSINKGKGRWVKDETMWKYVILCHYMIFHEGSCQHIKGIYYNRGYAEDSFDIIFFSWIDISKFNKFHLWKPII